MWLIRIRETFTNLVFLLIKIFWIGMGIYYLPYILDWLVWRFIIGNATHPYSPSWVVGAMWLVFCMMGFASLSVGLVGESSYLGFGGSDNNFDSNPIPMPTPIVISDSPVHISSKYDR
jgi:hypothetical protein